ncbi:MAG: SDR family oxidoreductase [Saprospiraceae bacterium]|nr:SDR family oxidoreductase [Saprospiraceae bacterium]
MKGLEGRHVLVTGGAKGIGEALVRAFAAEDSTVSFTYRHSQVAAQALQKELQNQRKRIHAFSLSTSHTEGVQDMIGRIKETTGIPDVLVLNAGMIRDALLAGMDESAWEEVILVNFELHRIFVKELLPGMMQRKRGAILWISSISANHGNAGQANYAAAKEASLQLMRECARIGGPCNVRCNALLPGIIDTAMSQTLRTSHGKHLLTRIPLRRYGTPEDVAMSALFLCSDQASYITGQSLQICGGLF